MESAPFDPFEFAKILQLDQQGSTTEILGDYETNQDYINAAFVGFISRERNAWQYLTDELRSEATSTREGARPTCDGEEARATSYQLPVVLCAVGEALDYESLESFDHFRDPFREYSQAVRAYPGELGGRTHLDPPGTYELTPFFRQIGLQSPSYVRYFQVDEHREQSIRLIQRLIHALEFCFPRIEDLNDGVSLISRLRNVS